MESTLTDDLACEPRELSPALVFERTGDRRLALICGFATLAPSSHNTQPWLFEVDAGVVRVFADRSRALPVVDPHDRELVISVGAAIGALEVAARRFRHDVEVAPGRPGDADAPLATIRFRKGGAATATDLARFEALFSRRTSRAPFKAAPPDEAALAACASDARSLGVVFDAVWDDDARREIAALVAKGDERQFGDPRFRRELALWVRSASLGARDGMSGSGFGMPDLLAPAARFAIRTFDLGAGVAASDRDKIMAGSPALALLSAPDDEPASLIAAGRALMRILLRLEGEGLSAGYLNQPIEREELRPRLGGVFGIAGAPQILLRVGEPTAGAPPSARRPIREAVRMAGGKRRPEST